MARKSSSKRDTSQRDQMLEAIKAEFDERLAAMAADPAQWIEFLDQVAVFGARYSMGNQLLLMLQAAKRDVTPQLFLPYGNKEATTGWRSHRRHVKAGETAFYVWAPVTRRPSEAQAAEWEAAGRTVHRDAKGRPIVQVVAFRPSPTFELSQTDGEPFEPPTVQRLRRIRAAGGQRPQLLEGDDPTGAFDDVVKLIKDEGYTFELVPPTSANLRGANGITISGQARKLVEVRDDVDPAQRVKTTVHELAHIRCGHLAETGHSVHRGRQETEAESVAHIVCAALGLDTRAYSDAYVLNWADGDLKLISACGEKIVKISRTILADLTPGSPEGSATAGSDTEFAAHDRHELVDIAG